MPIEVSQEALDENAYLNTIGIHWNGLVISRIGNNLFKIELIDPAYSPKEDIKLTTATLEQINKIEMKNLLKLIQLAASESYVAVQVYWLAAQQQSGDLDCR